MPSITTKLNPIRMEQTVGQVVQFDFGNVTLAANATYALWVSYRARKRGTVQQFPAFGGNVLKAGTFSAIGAVQFTPTKPGIYTAVLVGLVGSNRKPHTFKSVPVRVKP